MDALNPFKYGQTVENSCFFDRTNEQKALTSHFRNGQNVIVMAPRRYGKSSLIRKVLADLAHTGMLCLYIDLFRSSSLTKLNALLGQSLAEATRTPLKQVGQFFKEWAPRLKPTVVIRGDALPDLSFDWEGKSEPALSTLSELLDLLYRYTKKNKVHAVVAFDEFQEILEWGDIALLKELRALIQSHETISYCFAGSKAHLLSEIFLKKASPLFHFGTVMSLARIARNDFSQFLESALAPVIGPNRSTMIQAILDFTQCHPYYTQLFAYHLWEETSHGAIIQIEEVITHVMMLHGDAYVSLWTMLTSRQRNFLRALAHDEKPPFTQAQVITRWELGSAATVSKVIAHLERDGFIERFQDNTLQFSDPFFKIWVKRL